MRNVRVLLLLAALVLVAAACNGDDPVVDEPDEPDDAEVTDEEYDVADQPDDAAATFVSPADGDTVSAPVEVEMAAEGVDLVEADAPAVGEAHLHVMADVGCADDGEFFPGPSDEAEADGYFHFGDGSSEGEIDLEPGTYELCVQLGDGVHTAFGETDTITVTVE